MNQQPQKPAQAKWVRLHLVPQTETTNMPPYIEGLLTQETPGAYVLSQVIKLVTDDATYESELQVVNEMNFVNRTYVWNCVVLEQAPTTGPTSYNQGLYDIGGGGLG